MDVAVSPQPPPSASSTSPTPVRMRRMRRHGCQTPFAPAQIVALGVVLLNIAVFYVFSVHELPSELRRIVLVLVSVQIAMVTLLYIAISLLDPAHPAVIERQQQRLKPSTSTSVAQSPSDDVVDLECSDRDANAPRVASPALPSSSTSPSSSLSPSFSVTPTTRPPLQCALCDASVSSGTRHCSVCRKCVAGFDHHCVYINTCIGSRNYPLFIALLTCSILLVATQLVIACFAIDCLRRRGDTTRALVVGGLSLPPLLQLICMIVLASFHSYLFCKGLRTYEWLQRWSTQKTTHRYAAKTPTWKQQSCRMREYEDDDAHITHEDRSKDPQQHHNIIAQKIEVVAHV